MTSPRLQAAAESLRTEADARTTYPTEIKIWSRIGCTPITKRGGSYCDLLVDTVLECATPTEALALTKEIIRATPNGDYGHFYMPTYWNQNTRSNFTH